MRALSRSATSVRSALPGHLWGSARRHRHFDSQHQDLTYALVARNRVLHLMGLQVDWGDLANKIKTVDHHPIRGTCSPTALSATRPRRRPGHGLKPDVDLLAGARRCRVHPGIDRGGDSGRAGERASSGATARPAAGPDSRAGRARARADEGVRRLPLPDQPSARSRSGCPAGIPSRAAAARMGLGLLPDEGHPSCEALRAQRLRRLRPGEARADDDEGPVILRGRSGHGPPAVALAALERPHFEHGSGPCHPAGAGGDVGAWASPGGRLLILVTEPVAIAITLLALPLVDAVSEAAATWALSIDVITNPGADLQPPAQLRRDRAAVDRPPPVLRRSHWPPPRCRHAEPALGTDDRGTAVRNRDDRRLRTGAGSAFHRCGPVGVFAAGGECGGGGHMAGVRRVTAEAPASASARRGAE
jgi:hypothetical protein